MRRANKVSFSGSQEIVSKMFSKLEVTYMMKLDINFIYYIRQYSTYNMSLFKHVDRMKGFLWITETPTKYDQILIRLRCIIFFKPINFTMNWYSPNNLEPYFPDTQRKEVSWVTTEHSLSSINHNRYLFIRDSFCQSKLMDISLLYCSNFRWEKLTVNIRICRI